MGKQEREQFIAKNDIDVLLIKKAFFVICYIGLFIILLSIINTIQLSFITYAKGNTDYLPNSSALISYDYDFSTDTLVEINPPFNLTSDNLYYETTYDYPYNATFTFTGETGGTITGWTDEETGGTIQMSSYYNGHDYVIWIDDNGIGLPRTYHDFDQDQTSGTIELWILANDATDMVNVRLYENSNAGALAFRVAIHEEKLAYHNGTAWYYIGGALDDVWYHFRIDFDCNNDLYDVYVNQVLKAENIGSTSNAANIGAIGLLTENTPTQDGYFDAIDFSWDSNYSLYRSFYPNTTYTGVSQTAYWDFWHDEAGNYASTIHPIPFFTELTPTGSGNVQCENGYFLTTTLYDTDGVNGFYKTFTSNEGFYNITWKDRIGYLYTGHKDAWYGTALYDQSDNLITEVNITYDESSDIYSLQYNNGTNFVNLSSNISLAYYTEFNLYTDGNAVILRVNNSQVYKFSTTGFNDGLGKVSFTQAQLDDIDYRTDTRRFTDYVGIYINGTSQSNDVKTLTLDLNVSSFEPYNYQFMDISIEGNYSLTLSDDSGSETYLPYAYYTNTTQTINIYDFGDVYVLPDTPLPHVYTSNNPFLSFAYNGTITPVKVKIYSGIMLNDGDVNYYSNITYNNLNANDINFTTINGDLHYNAVFNTTSNQFAQFNFYRHEQVYLDEYVIDTSAYMNSTGVLNEMSVQYLTGNPNNYSYNIAQNEYYGYLTNYKYLTNIIITISDNPDDNVNRDVSGIFYSFTISYLKLYTPTVATAQNWVSLIIVVCCVFPVPIIVHIRIKKRYPQDKHNLLQYLIPAIIGCVITTALYFGNPNIMPLFVYITLFIGFFLLIIPSMLNRYLVLGLMFTSLMVYGGYFPSWVYIINLLIVSFTTILGVKNMDLGDR